MDDLHQTYIGIFKKASDSEEVALVKEAAGNLGTILLLSGVGLTSGLLGTALGKRIAQRRAEENAAKNKALTFGAGVLSGLVAPSVLGKLKNVAGLGLTPGGDYSLYDEFAEI